MSTLYKTEEVRWNILVQGTEILTRIITQDGIVNFHTDPDELVILARKLLALSNSIKYPPKGKRS